MFYRPLLPWVLLTACLFSVLTQEVWAEQVPKTTITAEQRQQIQSIGQSLLTARRQAKPSEQAMAIRQQLTQVKAQLDTLIAPLPVGRITLKLASPPAAVKTVAKTISFKQSWKQRHEKRIKKLDESLTKLNKMTDEVLLQRTPLARVKPVTKSLNLWQRLKSRILKQAAVSNPQNAGQNTAREESIHTDLSEAALNQLKTLQVEINEAMAQPDNQRPLVLRALSKRLTLSKYPPVTDKQSNDSENNNRDDEAATKTLTPTFTSRTTHRREF